MTFALTLQLIQSTLIIIALKIWDTDVFIVFHNTLFSKVLQILSLDQKPEYLLWLRKEYEWILQLIRQLSSKDPFFNFEITSDVHLALRRLLICPRRHIDMNSHLHISLLELDIRLGKIDQIKDRPHI